MVTDTISNGLEALRISGMLCWRTLPKQLWSSTWDLITFEPAIVSQKQMTARKSDDSILTETDTL